MYCISCGKELPDDSVFCQYCGAPIETKVVHPAPVTDEDLPIDIDRDSAPNRSYDSITIVTHVDIRQEKQNENNKWFSDIKSRDKYISNEMFYHAVMETSPLSTLWLRFYMNIFLPLEGIIFLIGYHYFFGSYLIMINFYITLMFTAVIFIMMRRFTLMGYWLNIALMSIFAVVCIASFDFLAIAVYFTFFACNFAYFFNRKFLFETDKARVNIAVTGNAGIG